MTRALRTRPTRRATIQARARALAGVRGTPQAATTDTTGTTPAATSAELWLYGVVGGYWWGFDAETVAYALRQMPEDVTDVTVRVHSPGGNAMDGIAIGNLFRNHPAIFRGVVDGLAASAASVMILGCDEVVVSPGAEMMIHDASVLTYGNAAQLRSDADWIDKTSQNYAEVYALRGRTVEEWRADMTADNGRGTYYTGTEAVAVGLADRVGTIQSVTPPPPPPDDDLEGDDLEEMEARAAWDRDVLCHPDAWAAWSSNPGALPRPPKPPTASADGQTPTEGINAVSFSDNGMKTLRAKLGGLAEDADEATILAALDEVLDEQVDPTPQATTKAVTPPDGTVIVDAELWAQTQAQAVQGSEARQVQLDDYRDRTIQAAIDKGKFAPARRAHFESAWKADPEGTEETIKALEPGLVPVAEIGHDQTQTDGIDAAADIPGLDGFAAGLGLTLEDFRA